MSEVADSVRQNGRPRRHLLTGLEEILLLLFVDDVVLGSSTSAGLQNQISSLQKASDSLGLTVNLDKSNDFQKGRPYCIRKNMVL